MSIYMLSNPNPSYASLLKPLFTPQAIPDTLLVILLDWTTPWSWLRQLRHWVQIVRSVLDQLPPACQAVMEQNMQTWRDRKRGQLGESPAIRSQEREVSLPLGPGEWDEGLGVPIFVICQNAEVIGKFEREHNWRDEQFDFILQSLRAVILKHGGSLLYTESGPSTSLQTLLRSILDVRSLSQRDALKHNVVDRDKVLVPPNWDSWGKIRVLGERFDIELLSNLWSIDIRKTPSSQSNTQPAVDGEVHAENDADATTHYEDVIRNPSHSDFYGFGHIINKRNNEVTCMDTQEFLAGQLQVLDALKAEDVRSRAAEDKCKAKPPSTPSRPSYSGSTRTLSEQIGPVQLNMGGIQVGTEDMSGSLKAREAERHSEPGSSSTPTADAKTENEKLRSFFVGLANRGSPSSAKGSKTGPNVV